MTDPNPTSTHPNSRAAVARLLDRNPSLFHALYPRMSWLIPLGQDHRLPHVPTPKQIAFLMLPHREAFYGGAAGGGKSDALLMAALQYADIPGYSAILFRKTLTDLKMGGALLDRAHQWLDGLPGVRYVAGEHAFYIQTSEPNYPAKIQFGYIGDQGAYIRYQGIEVQTCCFDELTQHFQDDYLYLFSRLRRLSCHIHKEKDEFGNPIYAPDCDICTMRKSVPIRMRAASNPGGLGHAWVKKRFSIKEHVESGEKTFRGFNPHRPFIPAFIQDNPHLDQASYAQGLDELGAVKREQLKKGNWDISEDSRFKKQWVKYYSTRLGRFCLGPEGRGEQYQHSDFIRKFTTVDPAGSAKEGPGDTERYKKQESWSVISTWGLTPDYNLLWLDCRRFRKEIPDILHELKTVYRSWKPELILIEINGLGRGAYQMALRTGLPMKGLSQHQDKVVRSTAAQVRMESGKIWLPQTASWLETVEEELFTWTGHPDQTDDIIDTLSMACNDIAWESAASEQDPDDPNNPSHAPGVAGPQQMNSPGVFGGIELPLENRFAFLQYCRR